jgi:hypothetical protein
LTVLSLKKTALPKLSGFKHQNEIEMTGKKDLPRSSMPPIQLQGQDLGRTHQE